MYYVYVLENELEDLYYGSTPDLKRRLQAHNAGKSLATKGHTWSLIYYEAYRSREDATTRERSIKRFGGTKNTLKIALAEADSLANRAGLTLFSIRIE